MKGVNVNLDDREHNLMEGLGNEDDFIRRYQNFKKFDTVVDHSDHLFSTEFGNGAGGWMRKRNWLMYQLNPLYVYLSPRLDGRVRGSGVGYPP
nr:hypothetical protein [Tanacetum cinerariifolium]